MSPAARRYLIRLTLVLTVYFAALIVTNMDFVEELPAPVLALVAILPVLPMVALVFVVLSFVGTMDEVKRRIITEASLVSMILVGLAAFTYGFLQPAFDLPDVSMMWVMPALIGTAGVMQIFVRRRYL